VRALITGGAGQLGRSVIAQVPAETTLRAFAHRELDIADAAAVESVIEEFRPDVVINAAGFTRVDDAEKDPAEAERGNALGPQVLAAACRRANAWLLHVSTDYVFDGTRNQPYDPAASTNPQSVYGHTKLRGELAVKRELPSASTVLRTSWVYGAAGRNFLTTMLRLMTTRPRLTVVSDQIGAPTSVDGLARAVWGLARHRALGTFHWCDSGVASWYDFAVAIAEEARSQGLVQGLPEVVPITAAEYPTPARRPAYSVLDKRSTERLLGVSAAHWRVALRSTLAENAGLSVMANSR
jgi:dTDP-4-dehydrorhamnose reductase